MKKDGGPAFPIYQPDMTVGDDAGPGMSLRDWFAGQALSGLLASGPHDCEEPGIAHDVYRLADAMLKEREKGIRE